MSGDATMSVDASRSEPLTERLRDAVLVEYVGIGAVLIALGLPIAAGVVSPPIPSASDIGALVVGAGVGTALYGHEVTRRSAAVFSLVLGVSLFTAGALQLDGVWAAILGIWGVALVLVGVASYAFTMMTRRGTQR